MPSLETITILAVVEAQDKASGILSGIFSSLDKAAEAWKTYGEATRQAGILSAETYLEGDTAAERLLNANSKLAGAQVTARAAATELTAAQKELADVITREGVGTEAAKEAQLAMADAQRQSTVAAGELRDAQMGQTAAAAASSAKSAVLKDTLNAAANSMLGIGAATVVAGAASVKMSGDFQQQTETLVSGAGVQQSQLAGVQNSILNLAQATGTSTKSLTDSFFAVNSRLGDVRKSTQVVGDAAEIAKVHMADLNTVSIAIASSMNAYAASGLTAGQASNILGVAVQEGGMSFQELANSLTTVLPKAQEAHLSFAQVAAAVATMTASGQSAQQATVDLAHTISKLQSPTLGMISTWGQLGLTQKQVADTLHGPGGLEAAMNLIADTAKSKLGPAGKIVVDTFKQSKDAASAMTTMLTSMDPAARSLSERLANGTIDMKAWTTGSKLLSGAGYEQATQFKALYEKSTAFNDAIKAGKPGFSGFSDLLKSAYGDATSMQTALLLGGTATEKWTKATKDAEAASKSANSGIQGWNATQGTLNQKVAQARESFQVMGITLGTALIPPVTKLVQQITPWVQKMADLIRHHQEATKDLFALGLAIGGVGAALKVMLGVFNLFSSVKEMIKGIKIAFTEYEIATKLAAGATKAWELIQVVFNAVLKDNPIGIVVTAIALLVGAAIYAFNHFKGFHDFVMASWTLLKTAATGLWGAMKTAFDGISTAAESVWNALVGAFNGIVNAVTGFGSEVWNDIQSVWDGIKEFFEKWWPLLLVIFAAPIAVLLAIWNHFHDQITSVATAVWNAVKSFFVTTWNFLANAAKSAWDLVMKYIITPLNLVWNQLQSWGRSVMGFLSQVWGIITVLTQGSWNLIYQYIVHPLQQAWHEVSGIFNGISSTIMGAINGVLSWLGNIGSWFVNIGIDIVNGIINGISSAGGALFQTLGNLANSALKAAKSFLGIGSPSKEFSDQVGQWIPHGIAQGVQQHSKTAIDAVTQLAGSLPQAIGVKGAVNLGVNSINAAGTVTATGLGLTSSGSAAQGATSVNITLDMREAVVAGDRGMDDFINKLGYALATRVLPQSGTRIHF